MRSSSRVVLVRAALAAGLVASGLAVAPAQAGAPARPALTIGHFRSSVSPDHDGYHDRLHIPITVAHRSTVSMTLRNLTTGRLVVDGSIWLRTGTQVIGLRELRGQRRYLEPGSYRLRLAADRPGGHRGKSVSATFEVLAGPVRLDPRAAVPAVSPNGDGSGDRTRVGYTLERRSRVWAVVRQIDEGLAVDRVSLGVLGKGHHGWRWDGLDESGAALPDGRYDLSVRAQPVVGTPRRAGVAKGALVVDTVAPDAPVRLNRTTVYPSATAIEDSLRIGVSLPPAEVTTAQVRSSDGRTVARLTAQRHECEFGDDYFDSECTLLTWNARTSGGPVAAGDYHLRLVLTDAAGNTSTSQRSITVSSAQLVERTGSITWTGATTPTATDFCAGNHCTEAQPCAPHASERFPDGVSFRADPDECKAPYGTGSAASYGFTPELAAGSTPYDRFRVIASGGPTTPTDVDTGWLSVGTATSTPLNGDQATASPWVPVRPDVELFAASDRRARWSAGATRPNRYDVATYTLEYTYFVPAS